MNTDTSYTPAVTKVFKTGQPFSLEQGGILPELEIAYTTHGTLNTEKNNVVWICHALTANADPTDWWPGLVGKNFLIDPGHYFIVCANVLGSCYGTTGPLSFFPGQKPFYSQFPLVTIRDMVNAHILFADHLGIGQIDLLMGGSLGGQQALEWSIVEPERIRQQVLIATNAVHSAYGIAFNESQRLAIFADPTYFDHTEKGGQNGLKAARSIALISYRTYEAYNETQRETDVQVVDGFRASGYQQYQGEKLVNRFNAYAYVALSRSMDSHNVGRHRGSVENALKCVRAKTLCIGISSDILYPPAEQKFIQQLVPSARYAEIDSFYGHDGFLIETEKLTHIISEFL